MQKGGAKTDGKRRKESGEKCKELQLRMADRRGNRCKRPYKDEFDYIICPSLSYLSRDKTKLASLINFIKENDKKLIYEEKGLIARIDPEDKEFLAKIFLPEISDAESIPPEQGMSL